MGLKDSKHKQSKIHFSQHTFEMWYIFIQASRWKILFNDYEPEQRWEQQQWLVNQNREWSLKNESNGAECLDPGFVVAWCCKGDYDLDLINPSTLWQLPWNWRKYDYMMDQLKYIRIARFILRSTRISSWNFINFYEVLFSSWAYNITTCLIL